MAELDAQSPSLGWRPSWEVFNAFRWSPGVSGGAWAPSWTRTNDWLSVVRRSAQSEANSLQPLLAKWDSSLRLLGGDPSRARWSEFRPLRLSREEDWSDWLAYLLAAPEGWDIAGRLFPPEQGMCVLEEVRREVPVASGDRRADLVLFWKDNRASHVEVKVWDEAFAKTAETGAGCRDAFGDRCGWVDYILVPEENEEACREDLKGDDVRIVTWTSVCIELRRALLAPRESPQWRAFARAFCGAVEQKILAIPAMTVDSTVVSTSAVFRFGRLLREAGNDQQEG